MEKNPKDRQLDTPGEANRDKHINFREAEEESATSSEHDQSDVDKEKGPLYMHDESPLKAMKRAANEISRSPDKGETPENK